tara:strand:+ start:334 stop:438 length:105 start_codon:yes stop_codon:yes gene_type:complete
MEKEEIKPTYCPLPQPLLMSQGFEKLNTVMRKKR